LATNTDTVANAARGLAASAICCEPISTPGRPRLVRAVGCHLLRVELLSLECVGGEHYNTTPH
jgi:hypothetical protein